MLERAGGADDHALDRLESSRKLSRLSTYNRRSSTSVSDAPLAALSQTETTLRAVQKFKKLRKKAREAGAAYLVRQSTRKKLVQISPSHTTDFEERRARQESIAVLKAFEASQQTSKWSMTKPPSGEPCLQLRLPTLPLHSALCSDGGREG